MFIWLFLCLIILVCLLSPRGIEAELICEPFTRKFFNQIIPTYFFGLDLEELLGNEFDMIKQIKEFIPFIIDTVQVKQSINNFKYLNENKTQFMLARTHTLYNVMHKTMPGLVNFDISNIRYVATLYRVNVTILTCNLQINEFGDLKNSGLTINVGQKYSGDYFVALDLLLTYGLVVGQDIRLSFYEWPQLLTHYGTDRQKHEDVDVIILTVSHPNMEVANLSHKVTTRVVEIRQINDGDIFHIALDEEKFYKDHPYYDKTLFEKDFLAQYYPDLVLDNRHLDPGDESQIVMGQGRDQNRFINAIGIRYYLLGNVQTPQHIVAQLLYNMKLNMNELNKFPFITEKMDSVSMADFSINLPVHAGTHEFNTKSGLYTEISNPACVVIDGKCTYQELYNHNLLNDFGKTFDQIYNNEPPPNYLKAPSQIIAQDKKQAKNSKNKATKALLSSV